MRRLLPIFVVLLAIVAILVEPVNASRPKQQPISSPIVDDTALTRFIIEILPDSTYFCITGALDPTRSGNSETALLFQTVRVVCPDLTAMQRAVRALKDCKEIKIKKLRHDIEKARSTDPAGYRGITVRFVWQDQEKTIQLLTFQQLRWLLWASTILPNDPKADTKANRSYAIAVSDYLDGIERGESPTKIPYAADFGLPQRFDLYQPLADDEIAFTDTVAEITTSFVRGITAFAPTDSALAEFKLLATNETFAETDSSMFQWQCREFFSSGQVLPNIKTLSSEGFRQLVPGNYAFAVGADNTVRFTKITESNTRRWSQLPHALLFCNQEVLTSGTFVIERDTIVHISKINIRSHTLLGNLATETEPRQLSDQRLTTLGRFFQALDRLGISYHGILISKF
ncbi:MAG: hypothetical protein NT028_08670 [candidate division Zixibacteria bacterium]|nr:hypothetical protein [candidate division Zixibacteria bacterium]